MRKYDAPAFRNIMNNLTSEKGKVLPLIEYDKKITFKLYRKIISLFRQKAKELGFKKRGSVNAYRIKNDILQYVNFQKSDYNPKITVNMGIIPLIEDLQGLRQTEHRLGRMYKGFDYWWHFDESNYEEVAEEIFEVFKKYAIPNFKKKSTIKALSKSKRRYNNPTLFYCALAMHKKRKANYWLKHGDLHPYYLKLFKRKYIQLLEERNWDEIDRILKKNIKENIKKYKLEY